MELITKAQMEQLLSNRSPENRSKDHKPCDREMWRLSFMEGNPVLLDVLA